MIFPTNLYSKQITQIITNHLNTQKLKQKKKISHYITLTHTKKYNISNKQSKKIYTQTLIKHLTHPTITLNILLKHKYKKTHNNHISNTLKKHNIKNNHYNQTNIQLNKKIKTITQKIKN